VEGAKQRRLLRRSWLPMLCGSWVMLGSWSASGWQPLSQQITFLGSWRRLPAGLSTHRPVTRWARGAARSAPSEEEPPPYEDQEEALADVEQLTARLDALELEVPQRKLEDQRRTREARVEAIFRALDDSGSGYLNSEAMKTFAVLSGFDEDDAAWREEFQLLCEDIGCQTSVGVDLEAFERLVNDPTEGGSYCSDRELEQICEELTELPTRPAKSAGYRRPARGQPQSRRPGGRSRAPVPARRSRF